MAPTANLEYLANSLVTAEQLHSLQDDDRSCSQNGPSLRFAQAILTQAAGVLLRLSQEVIATSIVLLQRFWVEGHGQGHATADLKVQIYRWTFILLLELTDLRRQPPKPQSTSLQSSHSPPSLPAQSATSMPACSLRPLLCHS